MQVLLSFGILALFLLMIALELIWSRKTGKEVYNLRETLGNLVILLGNQLLKPLTVLWGYLIFGWVYPYRLMDLPVNGWSFAGALLAGDLLYYWYHRLSHELRALWALHHVHHSSPWMNFTTAFRIHWMGKLINPLFFLPAILLGFSPEQMAAGMAINLVYQFFLHTEAVGRIRGIEGWLNTPSAHRVHHGSNELYIDKNYGGILMVWDRLFGTYACESEQVRYGVTTGFVSHNPLVVLFQPVRDFLQGTFTREKKEASPASRNHLPVRIFAGTLLLLVVLVLSHAVRAQGPSRLQTPEQRADTMTVVMKQELKITPEQEKPLYALNLRYAQKMQEEVIDSDRNAFSKMMRGRSLNGEKEKELKRLLTAAQWEAYEVLRTRMRDELMPMMMEVLESP